MMGYKELNASETVARLRRLDYCDEQRTADIITHLGMCAAASAALAEALIDLQPLLRDINYAKNGIKEVEAWCKAVKTMEAKGISG